jgi:hypothetical protein
MFLVIYLDDIPIFIHGWDDQVHHVRQVLEFLRKHKLQVKERKKFFGQKFM